MISGDRAHVPADGSPILPEDRVPPHPHLPVSAGFVTPLSDEIRERLDRLAREILSEEPEIGDQRYFSDWVTSGLGPGPNLVIEDHSGIALYDLAGEETYAFRGMMLAGDGDLVVLPRRNAAFEAYCQDMLGLGRPTIVAPSSEMPLEPLVLSCTRDPQAIALIAEHALQNGGLNIVPYMGSGNTWSLAKAVAKRSGVPLRVAAPMPRLTQRVNDKLWFARCVARALGGGAEPEVRAAYGPAALVYQVRRLSRRHQGLAVRVPDAASSVGSVLIEPHSLDGLSPHAVAERLTGELKVAGWRGRFPLMVTAWEEPLVASPSVQLWIPKASTGPPVVEAIFEQRLARKVRAFNGAEPSDLPPPVLQEIASQAAQLGYLFQQLGYYGRCSFDAILVGSDAPTAQLHWVECNGRWGGVSIPLTLTKRLAKGGKAASFLVLEKRDGSSSATSFDAVLHKLGRQLFDTAQQSAGVVILSPTLLERGAGFMVMILGHSIEALHAQAEELMQRLYPSGIPPRD